MAFSHHKIKIGGGQAAGQAVTYLADPQASGYYSESQRALMVWDASENAKAQLGLGDSVELWKVERLLRGQHPYRSEFLRRIGGDQTMVGAIDYTISPASKSVSILWAMASPELKVELEDMVIVAAQIAMHHVTDHQPIVRKGAQGKTLSKANDPVGMQVLHTTARATKSKLNIPDPQLHIHHLLFADLEEDGSLRAIADRQLLQYRSQIDAEAQGVLAQLLEKRGFEIERRLVEGPKGDGQRVKWEIKGIPASLIEAMSARSSEISDLMAEYREHTGREAAGPGWDKFVTGRRGAKSGHEAAELLEAWEREGLEHGFTSAQAAALAAAADRKAASWKAAGQDSPEAEQFRKELLATICRDNALVPARQLDIVTQQLAVGLVDGVTARRIVARLFGEGDLLETKDGMVTTLEVMAQEQRAERALDRLLEAEPGQAASPEELEREFDKRENNGAPFDPEQREAIALALSGARFVSIAGPAGTGKGYASRAMVDLWRAQERRVFALAVAGRTAQQAGADSGAEPMTLNGLQARTERGILQLRRSDVLLVDEAAMVDHARYADLLETAAEAGASIVQIGDDHQLDPVGPGGLWTIFHGLAEQRDLAVELRIVRRALNAAEAQAWTDLREGRIEQALTWYREQGQLRLYETRPELLRGLVDNWSERNRDGAMIVDTSNQERDSLNRMAQAKRLEAGELGADVLTLDNGRELRVGDRVIFHAIHHFPDDGRSRPPKRVENGTVASVLALDRAPQAGYSFLEAERAHAQQTAPPNRAILALDEPTGARVVEVDAKAPLELGYARHAQKSQGMTAVTSDIALSERTGQQRLYEMTSRAREGTVIHALRAEVEELVAEPITIDPVEQAAPKAASGASEPQNEAQLSERAKIEHDLASIRERLSHPGDYHPAVRELDRDLAAALERALAKPEASTAALPEVRSEPIRTTSPLPIPDHAAEIPEGAVPWTEVQQQLEKGRQALEQRDTVTIRQAAKTAARAQPKQAVGRTEMAPAREIETKHDLAAESIGSKDAQYDHQRRDQVNQDRTRLADRLREAQNRQAERQHTERDRTPDEIRQQTRERIQARLSANQEAVREKAQQRAQIPEPMPARSAQESVARYQLANHESSREGLAMYQAMGQLHSSKTPELQAAERAIAQRHDLVVVENPEQEARVRGHLNTAQQAQQAQHESDRQGHEVPTQVRVTQASQLYQERTSTREQWREQTPAEHQHHAEPSAPERGLVLVTNYHDQAALTRGTSSVKEAHLVIGQPGAADQRVIEGRTQEIQAQQAQQAAQRAERQGAEAQQQMHQQAVDRSAGRTPEHSAEHSAQHAGAQHAGAEHAGAER